MQIQSTNNYDRFVLLQGNRVVNEVKVKHLVDAIARKNLLHLNPIQVNERLEVIDGQHRLEAARRLNVPIFYIIERGLSIDDAILENSHISGWISKDYLQSWVDRGYEDYRVLAIFCEQYNLAITVALGLLSGKSPAMAGGRTDHYQPNSLVRIFKEGRLRLRSADIKKAEIFAEKLMEVKPFTEHQIWRSSSFMSALKQVYDKTTHTHLMKKLKTHSVTIKRNATVKEYLRQFEDILNYKARTGHTVRLYE